MATSKKFTIPLTIFVVIVVSVSVTLFLMNQKKPPEDQNLTPTATSTETPTKTPSETPEAEDPTDKPVVENPVEIPEENPKHQAQNEGEDPNKSATITGVITRADVSNDKLVLRVNIDQYLSGGTCTLTVGNYTEVANVADSASTSTCEGFDIPLSKLASGEQALKIDIASGDKQGTITGKVAL